MELLFRTILVKFLILVNLDPDFPNPGPWMVDPDPPPRVQEPYPPFGHLPEYDLYEEWTPPVEIIGYVETLSEMRGQLADVEDPTAFERRMMLELDQTFARLVRRGW